MVFTIEQIKDYCKCPMLYKLKYSNSDLNPKINLNEKFDIDIRKSIYAYFCLIQNKNISSMSSLKRSWGQMWLKNKTTYDIVFADKKFNDEYELKRKMGLKILINMYNNFTNDNGIPIVINKPFVMNIGQNISVSGNFDIIREINEKIQLIVLSTNKLYNYSKYNYDLMLQSYVFLKSFKNMNKYFISYYDLIKNKIRNYSSIDIQYSIFIKEIYNICKAIYNKLFYMKNIDNNCTRCPYKKECIK